MWLSAPLLLLVQILILFRSDLKYRYKEDVPCEGLGYEASCVSAAGMAAQLCCGMRRDPKNPGGANSGAWGNLLPVLCKQLAQSRLHKQGLVEQIEETSCGEYIKILVVLSIMLSVDKMSQTWPLYSWGKVGAGPVCITWKVAHVLNEVSIHIWC